MLAKIYGLDDPSFDDYISDLAGMFDAYPTKDYGHLYALPEGKRFVGFDTAHAFQPHFSLDTVKQDCFDLIDQIIAKNGEKAWN